LKILVFEYVTGGGMAAETPSPSLLREGAAMLAALLDDLLEVPGIRVLALRDARLPVPDGWPAGIEWAAPGLGADAERRYAELLAQCDAAWPIAPETGGILERLCHLAEAAGKPLLTSPAAAVRVAASKLETARRLEARGVPAVATAPLAAAPEPRLPCVVKPDDGCGCEGARIITTPEDWRRFASCPIPGDYVVQPLVEGDALSLSALFADGKAGLLSVNRQRVARQGGGFLLRGCVVNAAHEGFDRYADLAGRIAAAFPELWGYVGVDFLSTAQGPQVLEINPRLTTSYAALKASTGLNPAGLVLDLWRSGGLPRLAPPRRVPVDVDIDLERGHEH
jgi:predicted ATP-grasp superfamily ATP-dependent carboligase